MQTKAEPIPESVVNNSTMTMSSSSSIAEVKDDSYMMTASSSNSSNVINSSSDISTHNASPLRNAASTTVSIDSSSITSQQVESTGTAEHELASFEMVSENEMSKLLDIQTSEK